MSRSPALLALISAAFLSACASYDTASTPPADAGFAAAPEAAAGKPGAWPALSPSARQVSEIAARNGDRDYIMVDKPHGQIIMFQDGQPLFAGSALTGQSLADRLPPGALDQPFTQHPRTEDKITPAGRYTVSIEPDPHYGQTLSVNEVQGQDWDIAVHRIFLGFPQEYRDKRLASADGREKHITWGCIDVSDSIMHKLIAALPDEDATPFYIIPNDEAHLASYFPPRAQAMSRPE